MYIIMCIIVTVDITMISLLYFIAIQLGIMLFWIILFLMYYFTYYYYKPGYYP